MKTEYELCLSQCCQNKSPLLCQDTSHIDQTEELTILITLIFCRAASQQKLNLSHIMKIAALIVISCEILFLFV